MTATLTADEAIESLRKAVAEKGADHRAKQCNYTNYYENMTDAEKESLYGDKWQTARERAATGPCCIVGQVLFDNGVPVKQLVQFEGNSARTVVPEAGNGDVAATHILLAAQMIQDSYVSFDSEEHKTWGEALEVAEGVYEVLRENPELATAFAGEDL